MNNNQHPRTQKNLRDCERILITLQISDAEVVDDYKNASDEIVWDDLVNGELINFAEFVSRKNTASGKCDVLCEIAMSIAGHIRKPYTREEIAARIKSGDYNAEMMMQHLVILATNPNPTNTMTSEKQTDDGGAAFPHMPYSQSAIEWSDGSQGMTLRDYFAAAAIMGSVGYVNEFEAQYEASLKRTSKAAYRIADAMLQARKAAQ